MSWEYFISTPHLTRLGIALGIFLLFLLFRKLFTKYIFALLLKLTRRSKHPLLPIILLAFEKPVQWFFVIIGLWVGLQAYSYHTFIINDSTDKLFNVSITLLVIWGLFKLSSSSSMLFRRINEQTSVKIDEIMIPFLSRALQFVVLAIGTTIVLQFFDVNISGLVAGLGIGGLAFSLAAKDALANLFGGVIIITEKPFTIDDWIKTGSVEGTVEDITFRSTKVRTFAQALVTVPNDTLANEAITNWTKMGKREIYTKMKLRYDTPRDKVQSVVDQIESLLHNHEGVDQEYIVVAFDEMEAYGLDVLLYFFTKTTAWYDYLKVREDLNLSIMKILEDEGVFIALPSQQLFMDEINRAQEPQHESKQTQTEHDNTN